MDETKGGRLMVRTLAHCTALLLVAIEKWQDRHVSAIEDYRVDRTVMGLMQARDNLKLLGYGRHSPDRLAATARGLIPRPRTAPDHDNEAPQ